MPEPSSVSFGVALGGGSARGYAHLGALACLERHGLVPSVVVGTSFGAVVGALYATGQDLEQLIERATAMRRRDVIPHVADFGLHRAALFKGQRLEEYFDRLLEGREFSDLTSDLVVVTTDVETGERVLLREGRLAPALRASASLPGVFAPVEIGGRRLIDGGIGSPVPIDTVLDLGVEVALGIGAGMESRDSRSIRAAQRALASRPVRRLQESALRRRPRSALGRLGRAVAMAADSWRPPQVVPARPAARSFEVHTRPGISWLNFDRAAEAIAAGEAALRGVAPLVVQARDAVLAGRAAAPVAFLATAGSHDALAEQTGGQLY